MTDLTVFLRRCLDEDEAVADAVVEHLCNGGERGFSLDKGDLPEPVRQHILHTTPGRLRAEVEAKRRILDLTELEQTEDGGPLFLGGYGEAYWDVVRLLTTVFADRPGYDESWRP